MTEQYDNLTKTPKIECSTSEHETTCYPVSAAASAWSKDSDLLKIVGGGSPKSSSETNLQMTDLSVPGWPSNGQPITLDPPAVEMRKHGTDLCPGVTVESPKPNPDVYHGVTVESPKPNPDVYHGVTVESPKPNPDVYHGVTVESPKGKLVHHPFETKREPYKPADHTTYKPVPVMILNEVRS